MDGQMIMESNINIQWVGAWSLFNVKWAILQRSWWK